MQLKDYLDIDALEQHIADGFVDRRYHRTLPLTIYCYSRKATYEDHWTDITKKCRGLVVDAQGTVVGRPFEKFFNVETSTQPETWLSNIPANVQPQVFEKLDGSLGTIWRYGNFTGVASKGSFQSDHAEWATRWYAEHCPNPQWPEGYTPVVEMICQCVQRHVVQYDILDQLILLALINNETGEELPYNDLYHWAKINGLHTVDIFAKSLGDVLSEDRPNKEGYVLSYPRPGQTPLKIKVKHETFLKLQKIFHAATPKSILEALRSQDFDLLTTWIEGTPPELSNYIHYWVGRLNEEYGRILVASNNHYRVGINEFRTRRDFAEYVTTIAPAYAPVIFALLDGKDHSPIIWKLVEKNFGAELNRPAINDPEHDNDEKDI